jgi:PAS domain S-box-containing protein
MTLSEKLRLATTAALLITVALAMVLVQAHRRLEDHRVHFARAIVLSREISELRFAAIDSIMRPGERAREQFELRLGSIARQFDGFPVGDPQESGLLTKIQSNLDGLRSLSKHLLAGVAPEGDSRAQPRIRDLIVDQVLVKSQVMMAASIRLAQLNEQHAGEVYRDTLLAASSFVLLLTLTVGLIALVVTRSVIRPIRTIQAALNVISQGAFDHKIGLTSSDEIGALARAFDLTTTELRRTIDSRDGLAHEVLERRRAEEARAASDHRLAIAMRTGAFSCWIWDIERDAVTLVAPAEGESGGSTERSLGTIAQAIAACHPEDQEALAAALTAAVDGKHDYAIEYRQPAKGGRYQWYSSVAIVERDADGRPLRMIGATIDITARRLAAEALRESEARFRQLADALPQIVWTATPSGEVDYLNARWYACAGVERDGSPRDWLALLPEVERETTRRIWYGALGDGKTFEVECRLVDRRSGRHLWHLLRVTPLCDGGGRIVRWIGSFTDIDDRKRAEVELQALNDELEARVQKRTADLQRTNASLQLAIAERERSNRDLERFAYIASHDLQEPLRAVSSHVGLLARRYRGRLDARADSYMAYACDGAARMQALINDILAFSRIRPDDSSHEAVELETLLDEALDSLAIAIRKAGATITHDPLPRAHGCPSLLRQLLQNLLSNAIKFRGEEPPHIHVAARSDGHEHFISVRDNGIGIEPQHRERVFEIFQRLHGRNRYEGTGLGLAICRRVVEQHGGRIWIEPSPGRGATFVFTLPVVPAAEAAVHPGVPEAAMETAASAPRPLPPDLPARL